MTNLINEDMLNQAGEESCCCGGAAKNEEGCCKGEDSEASCNCMNEEDGHNHEHDHHGHAHGEHHHDHDHAGHDHEHDHEHEHNQVVTFENEDGTTSDYPVVDEFEFDGSLYVLVLNADDTVTPLRSVGEEGDLEFLTEEEFDEVSKAYNEILDSEDEEETEDETEV